MKINENETKRNTKINGTRAYQEAGKEGGGERKGIGKRKKYKFIYKMRKNTHETKQKLK